MTLKKLYVISGKEQIFRIIISVPDKLIIERRNIKDKQAYFSAYDIFLGEKIFTNLQFEEKYWVGVESSYKNIIYFHKYAKPDMPGHRSIIAVDINSAEIMWKSDSYTYLFVHEDILYCSKQEFGGQNYFALDYSSGQVISDYGNDFDIIKSRKADYEDSLDYSDYSFPEFFVKGNNGDKRAAELLEKQLSTISPLGDIEFLVHGDWLFYNYHSENSGKGLLNSFKAFNLINSKLILSKIINSNINAFAPDSFFVYKNLLLLLEEKRNLLVYKIN